MTPARETWISTPSSLSIRSQVAQHHVRTYCYTVHTHVIRHEPAQHRSPPEWAGGYVQCPWHVHLLPISSVFPVVNFMYVHSTVVLNMYSTYPQNRPSSHSRGTYVHSQVGSLDSLTSPFLSIAMLDGHVASVVPMHVMYLRGQNPEVPYPRFTMIEPPLPFCRSRPSYDTYYARSMYAEPSQREPVTLRPGDQHDTEIALYGRTVMCSVPCPTMAQQRHNPRSNLPLASRI